MAHHYIRSDGNGGVNISMSMMALISLALMIVGSLATTVYGYGTLNAKVDQLQTYFAEAGPRHTQEMNDARLRISVLEQNSAVINAKLDVIQSDIKEVKIDVKNHITYP